MNRNLAFAAAALLALAPFASAQTQTPRTQTPSTQTPNTQAPGTQPGQPGARNAAFAATFDLLREVNGLSVLNKTPKTAVTKAQAQKLLPILKGLQTAKTLPAATAQKTVDQMEAVLTDPQLTALDSLALQRPGQGRFGPGQGGSGQGGFGQRGTQGTQTAPGSQATPGAQGGQGAQAGQPGSFRRGGQRMAPGGNPFLRGRAAQNLSTLIAALTKTAS